MDLLANELLMMLKAWIDYARTLEMILKAINEKWPDEAKNLLLEKYKIASNEIRKMEN